VLALLYHDVGKWSDTDHHVESVRMARVMFDRLELPAESRALVEFLIDSHLRMSLVAFRRDSEDPEIVRKFAEVVGIEERLKMLCLLTYADVSAVSPETLTPWREELLWRLYVDTYNRLTIGSNAKAPPGSSPSSPSTSRRCFPISAACSRRSAWTSSAAMR
jgi:[protein-PII] uridylyltransferase